MEAPAGRVLTPPPSLAFGPDLPLSEGAPASLGAILIHASEQAERGRLVRVGRDGEDTVLCYGELRTCAERILGGLRADGARPGDAVILHAAAAEEFVPALWSCLLGGYTVVPVGLPGTGNGTAGAGQRLRDVWTMLGRPRVVAGAGAAEAAREALGPAARVARVDELAAHTADRAWHSSPPESLAALLLSSGTTGRPKLIQRTHFNLLRVCQGTAAIAGLAERKITFLNWLPLDHNAALTASLSLLAAGAHQIHLDTQDVIEEPLRWLDALDRFRVSYTGGTNYSLGIVERRVAASPERAWDLSCVERLTVTAEPVVARTAHAFLERMAPHGLRREALRIGYGMSEVGGIARLAGLPQEETSGEGFMEVGTPFPGISLRVVDPQEQVVPEGCEGRVQVRGDTVTPGYALDPAGTRASFTPDGWFDTGDLGVLRGASLRITGRDKDVLIVNGVNLQSQDVEAAVEEVEGVERGCTAVCAVRIPGHDTDGAAVFLHSARTDPGARDALRRRVRVAVGARFGMSVAHVLLVDRGSLPRTSLGKVRRLALRRALEDGGFAAALAEDAAPGSADAGAPARTELEREICAVWASVLGVERVGIHDDFLGLGGHSLVAARVAAGVREAAGVEVPLRLVLEHPTVAGLAAAVETLQESEGPVLPLSLLRAPLEGPLPLSPAQQGLWLADQLDPGSSVYNLSRALRLFGALDARVLARVLAEIVARHEPLRTAFQPCTRGPVQVVGPAPAPEFAVEDLTDVPAAGREPELTRRLRAAAEAPFALAEGPLFRASLLRLAKDEHVLVLCAHHIVVDGWSFGVLFREIEALYRAFLGGEPSPLPPLPLRYADHAIRSRAALAGDALERHLTYWRTRLHDAPALLELPTDRVRPPVRSHRGATCRFVLPRELGHALAALGRSEGATPFMTLLAAFTVLLARYSGRDDVVVGTPAASRPDPELEGLIGLFVNTLAVRTDLSGRPSFRQLLGRVREGTLGAYAHAALPVDRLVEDLHPERSLGHAPVFQVVLALQNAGGEPPRLAGMEVRPVPTGGNAAMFDLTLNVDLEDGELRGALEYATDLFDRATAERMMGHLRVLLEAVVADPERPVRELEMMHQGERARVHTLAAPVRGFAADETLHARFARRAARTPGAVAVTLGGERLTYRELDRRSDRLGRALRARGVGPEVRVGICLERSLEMVVAILGVLKAGGAYVPLDPAAPAERLAYLVHDAGLRLVLSAGGAADRLTADAAEVLEIDGAWAGVADGDAPPLEERATAETLAYVIYTSGSTGRPKGVEVTHANVTRLFSATEAAFGFGAKDVWTLFHSYAFDFSVWEIWGALLYGGRLLVVPYQTSRAPEELHRLLVDEGVTVLSQTPSAFRQLMAAEQARGTPGDLALRWIVFGGEALEPGMLRPWMERHGDRRPRLVNMYGITETTVHVTCREMTGEDAASGRVSPIGRPLPDLGVHLLDAAGRPVPVGVPGEMYVSGAGVARGYLGRPALTAQRFVPDPFGGVPGARMYRSGDRARWTDAGELEYRGRVDEQVKIRGFRIEPGEVDAVLRACPGVHDCAVVAREDAPGELRLVGYVVPPPAGGAPDRAALRAHLAAQLPDYMVPAAFVTVPRIPLTVNGKADHRALPPPEPAAAAVYHPPATATEEVLAAIWADLLRAPRVGREDGFFELGGHSLLAARLIARTREALHAEVPLRALFEAPVLREFARRVDAARDTDAAAPLPPVLASAARERAPLSHAQQRFWFLHQLAAESPAYNTPVSLRLTGALDVAALSRALREIVRRHDALRARFEDVRGDPVQVVDAGAELAIPLVDLEELPAGTREVELLRLARAEASRPFRLSDGAPLRATLVRLAEEDHALLLTTHHIVFDGSHGVFFRELNALYAAFARGEPSPLPPLAVQYGDFAAWQHAHLGEGALERQAAYWRGRLADAPTLLELPTDRARKPRAEARGAVCSFPVPREVRDGLREVGRRSGVTLFMTVLAAFQVLLARYSGQPDVLVGTPVAHRARPELDELIGCFTNSLVLRTTLEDDPAFPALLARVREACLDAYAHQDVPFERLVGELKVERRMGHSPLFQVMLVLHPYAGAAGLQLPGVRARAVGAATGSARFDLLLAFSEREDGLAGALEYNADLFDARTASRMTEHLGVLLAAVAAGASGRASELPLLAGGERRRLLEEWNETARAYPRAACIQDAFEARAACAPAAPAVVFEGRVLTYGALDARANQLAHHLRRLGVGRGTPVAVWLERSAEMVAAVLAVLKAGGTYVPMEPAWPEARVGYILGAHGIGCVLSERSMMGALERVRAAVPGLREVVCLDGLSTGTAAELAPLPTTAPPRAATADDLAYVIFTSGSTGTPKGVMVQHRPVVNLIDWFNRTFEIGADDRVLFVTSLCFDLSVYDIFGLLAAGGSIRVASRAELQAPERLVDAVAREGITLWDSAPAALQQLVPFFPRGGAPASRLRRVFLSGDWIPVALPDQVRGAFPGAEVVSLGGATEAVIWSNFHRIGEVDPEWSSIPYGVGIQNARYYVLDRRLEPQPTGVPGDLYIGGECLAVGYARSPALTAEKFVPDPFSAAAGARLYRTGDRARWKADGWLEFLGRVDQQVKIRGYRIELGEVESVLAEHPVVGAHAVVVREDLPGDRRLVAYVVAAEGTEPAAAALRAHVRERLPEYMVPSAVVFLDALPVTANGKLDRRALPVPDASEPEGRRAFTAPGTPSERALADVWSRVLGVGTIGVEDDFFDLGGHSLLAIRVVAASQEALGVALPLRLVFEHPRLGELAAQVDAAREARDRELLELVHELSDDEVRALLAEEADTSRQVASGWE